MNAQDTPVESKSDLPLEIAHLLLIDVVGYSKLLIDEQIELLHELIESYEAQIASVQRKHAGVLVWPR